MQQLTLAEIAKVSCVPDREYAARVRALGLALALLVVVAAVLMVRDAAVGGDWPGWDEGWALVAFPLGVPVVLAGALAALSVPRLLRSTIGATVAVWAWGAGVFVVWHVLG